MQTILLLASLWTSFVNPPESAKPWCYWWWINGHVDRETITADLESMKALGFGGVLMFDSRGYWDDDDHVVNPKAEIAWGSDAWYDNVEFSVRECARLGLVFTMNASASGGTLNGFIDGREYETDIMDRSAVRAHLDRAVGPLLKRVPDLVGKTFTHIYSVSYEGNVRTGGSWKAIKDAFYATMVDWARAHGLGVYSESGGPWCWGSQETKLDCSQLDMLAHNDFPQGEFWPLEENGLSPKAGHANMNGRYFSRAVVLTARRERRPIVSLEAFTHMHRHWTVDPAFLKPLADIAYADGVNRLVWHTFTCSPKKFGVPGAEYFAGSHINRNVTWQKDAAPFVRYLGRCQALLQRGAPIDDGEFTDVQTNYYGWGRFRRDEKARFTTTHRREGDVDFFFVAGEGRGELVLNAALNGRRVELWDAVDVRRHPLVAKATDDGDKTVVTLDLPKGGSCFVVFTADPDVAQSNAADSPVQTVDSAWNVSFSYHPGVAARPPEPVTMNVLRDFTSYGTPDAADSRSIRYFSGEAVYRTKVELTADAAARVRALELGALKTGVAHVWVNGVDCGVVWCAPWRVRVPDVFKPGENRLEIRYTNNWHNRLVGDCRLAEAERVTRSTLHYWTVPRMIDPKASWNRKPTVYSGPSSFDALQPSGLVGPVRLVGAPPAASSAAHVSFGDPGFAVHGGTGKDRL